MGSLREISPFVASSNPALGTIMDFWNKPATLLLPLLDKAYESAYVHLETESPLV